VNTLPTIILLTAALSLASATVARAATISNWLALTITNPAPAGSDWFGISVAAVGTDRVVQTLSPSGPRFHRVGVQ
jgi:hypothetical protein